MSNQSAKHYVPRHAHKKAIDAFRKQRGSDTYPLREINGMHGGLMKTSDRKRPVAGLRVHFTTFREERFDGTIRVWSTNLQFERTF